MPAGWLGRERARSLAARRMNVVVAQRCKTIGTRDALTWVIVACARIAREALRDVRDRAVAGGVEVPGGDRLPRGLAGQRFERGL
jgi:hypothetical protein